MSVNQPPSVGPTPGPWRLNIPYYLSAQRHPTLQRANILLVLLVHIMVVVVVLSLDGRITLNTLLLSGAL